MLFAKPPYTCTMQTTRASQTARLSDAIQATELAVQEKEQARYEQLTAVVEAQTQTRVAQARGILNRRSCSLVARGSSARVRIAVE